MLTSYVGFSIEETLKNDKRVTEEALFFKKKFSLGNTGPGLFIEYSGELDEKQRKGVYRFKGTPQKTIGF